MRNTPLKATDVQLSSKLGPTPAEILRRYRENRHWRLYPKEWIYRNLFVPGEILDFGCGTGEITTQLAWLGATKVYALDVRPELLAMTAKRAELDGVADRVETICGYVQDIEPRAVDMVIAYAVLHHCHPIPGVLPHILKWLRPGGVFVCVEPVAYFEFLDRLRARIPVPYQPLDEGERKLNREDVDYIKASLGDPRLVHFRLLGRLDRWLPDRLLRRIDRVLLALPGAWSLAGTVLIYGTKKG